MKKLMWMAAIAAIGVVLAAQPAGATLMLSLGVGNPALSGFAGPYGSVSVSQLDATHAQIVFLGNTVAGNEYLFGDGGSVAVNLKGGAFNITATGFSHPGFTPGPISFPGPGSEDGFGNFTFKVDDFDGYTHSFFKVQLDIEGLFGTTFASDSDILTPNGSGFLAGAHIFVTTAPADPAGSALVTGFAADGGTPTIPEPTTMLLLGLGLAGAGVVRRRRKN
jgi:PEP-CTERM motif-containing protein